MVVWKVEFIGCGRDEDKVVDELSEFIPYTAEQVEQSKRGTTQFRSKAVCVCGHSEGAHSARRNGLAHTGFQDCRIGKVACACLGFKAVIEADSVADFRARPGKQGSGHPLAQGIARYRKRVPDGEIRKLDAWKCGAPGCGSTGQLIPTYLRQNPGTNEWEPAIGSEDTGVTVLACPIHAMGA